MHGLGTEREGERKREKKEEKGRSVRGSVFIKDPPRKSDDA